MTPAARALVLAALPLSVVAALWLNDPALMLFGAVAIAVMAVWPKRRRHG
jgi:4-hydroxybenzoate polyprenyltransferase